MPRPAAALLARPAVPSAAFRAAALGVAVAGGLLVAPAAPAQATEAPTRQEQCLAKGGTFVAAADNPMANAHPTRVRRDLCSVRTWTEMGWPTPYGPTVEMHVWQPKGPQVVVRERVDVGEPTTSTVVLDAGVPTTTTTVQDVGEPVTTAATRPVGDPVVVEELDTSTAPHQLVTTSTQQTEVVTTTSQDRQEVVLTRQPRKAVTTTTQAQELVSTATRPGQTWHTYTTKTTQATFTYTHFHRWTDTERLVPMSIYWVTTVDGPGPDDVVEYPLPEPKVTVQRLPVADVVTRTTTASPAERTESARTLEPLVTESVEPGEPVVTVTRRAVDEAPSQV